MIRTHRKPPALRQLRGSRAAVLLVALGLLTAACGSTAEVVKDGEVVGGGSLSIGDDSSDPLLDEDGEDVTTDGAEGDDAGSPGSVDASGVSSGGSGSSGSTGSASGSASGGGSGSGGAPGAAGGSSGAPGATAVGGHAPGVTASTVRIGFITIDSQNAATTTAAFGGDLADGGDPEQQVRAIVDHINKTGGIAGRRVIPEIRPRDTSSTNSDQGQEACEFFTKDRPVFAVVTNYRIDDGVEQCFAKRHTLFINDGVEPVKILQETKPYTWVPGLPSQEGGFAAYIASLVTTKFLDKGAGKLGVVAEDSPDTQATFKNIVLPRLKAAGYAEHVKVDVMEPAGTQEYGQWSQEIQGAVLQMSSAGVDRVIFMAPGGGVPIIFMNQAESQNYRPRYGLSSYDSPGLLIQKAVSPNQLKGAVGGGFVPIADIDPSQGDPFPTGKGEQQCVEALKSIGAPKTRANAYGAMYLCDGAFMLQAAGRNMTGLSTEAWAARADRLGGTFQAGYAHPGGTFIKPGRYYGGTTYRELFFKDSCRCFAYSSKPKPVPE